MKLEKINDYMWRIPKTGGMRVEGLIYASEKMLGKIVEDKAAEQVRNVATLPGIVKGSFAMPDIHWGYGFPIGGVAAMRVSDGVISPGGIGYDISCGVRLLSSNLEKDDIEKKLGGLADGLFYNVPSGVGSTGKINLSIEEVKDVLTGGSRWAVENGYGQEDDLDSCEDGGVLSEADPDIPGHRAIERGRKQLGTLGSGNHFLEIQLIDKIYDESVASVFGLRPGQITVMIHTGSRGLGYQVCDDYIRVMQQATRKYGISVPDRQLCCAPITSREGRDYFAAMCSAANYARANRQVMTHWIREVFMKVLDISPKALGMDVVYDVCHNIGKIEEHEVKGESIKVCVHRKGATRAFPKTHKSVPEKYRDVGQPVIIPGTMGTRSYVAVGTDTALKETFGTACHGAGRMMSRKAALRQVEGRSLHEQLKNKGIIARTASFRGLAEEAPLAYKDVADVVDVCHKAGIAKKVARMIPLGVVQG